MTHPVTLERLYLIKERDEVSATNDSARRNIVHTHEFLSVLYSSSPFREKVKDQLREGYGIEYNRH